MCHSRHIFPDSFVVGFPRNTKDYDALFIASHLFVKTSSSAVSNPIRTLKTTKRAPFFRTGLFFLFSNGSPNRILFLQCRFRFSSELSLQKTPCLKSQILLAFYRITATADDPEGYGFESYSTQSEIKTRHP